MEDGGVPQGSARDEPDSVVAAIDDGRTPDPNDVCQVARSGFGGSFDPGLVELTDIGSPSSHNSSQESDTGNHQDPSRRFIGHGVIVAHGPRSQSSSRTDTRLIGYENRMLGAQGNLVFRWSARDRR